MSFRYALKPYVESPERHANVVLYYDSEVTIIKDKYPKSSVHLLILPRNPSKTKQIPIKAFDDLAFKESMKKYIEIAKEIVVKEFKKKWKPKHDRVQLNILSLCHAVPSLNNLHIHVMTDDFYSTCLKNKKHFNSFQPPFAIFFDKLPLPDDDPIRNSAVAELELKKPLIWAGDEYGSKFTQLKKDVEIRFKSQWERA